MVETPCVLGSRNHAASSLKFLSKRKERFSCLTGQEWIATTCSTLAVCLSPVLLSYGTGVDCNYSYRGYALTT